MSIDRPLISICVPVFNEEDNIDPFHARFAPVLAGLAESYRFEFLFTDNSSEDATFEKLLVLSERDPRVRVIRFSRNFGFQRSILANYNNARGDAALQIDVDLQDPPELLPEFLRLWREGYKVIYGVRQKRPNESWALVRARKVFYRLIDFLSEDKLPHDAGDFRLIDRRILDELRSTTDQHPYVRGMIATMGFKQVGLVYDRSARARGSSKFNFWRLLSLAIDGILHHSTVPLRIATVFGLAMSCLAAVGAIYFLIDRLLAYNRWPSGIATICVLMFFSLGFNSLLLGILGEYIGRIYQNVQKSTLTIVESVIDRQSAEIWEELPRDAEAGERESVR